MYDRSLIAYIHSHRLGWLRKVMTSFHPRFMPYFLMVLVQICYSFMYIVTEASFIHGMDDSVYVTYRNLVAGLVMLPFAYFFERKKQPKMTPQMLLEINILSLLGGSLTLNMYFTGLKYTSATVLACMVNTIGALTFILAIILRMESVNIRSPYGIAKILGTGISLAGVMTMTLYKGHAFENHGKSYIHVGRTTTSSSNVSEDWLKGSVLVLASCVCWSLWYIMQASTLKRYPAQLSLTTWMSLVGSAQSAVFTAIVVQHRPAAWIIGLNIDLASTLYGGIVISGVVTFIQLWCTERKGPVFVTMFNPLSALLVAILEYFALGGKLFVGSLIGGFVVVVGLYLLLWGKEHDETQQMKDESDKSTAEA